MSCWVTPAVAAEYWGVAIDVVWDRIHCDLVPHKNERGFVFVDVDPWTPAFTGHLVHEPPPTFVPAVAPEVAIPVTSGAVLGYLDPEEEVFLSADQLRDEEVTCFAQEQDIESDIEDEGDFADESDEDQLPELDEEESATFGRLSWQDVRQSVGRTRRPPPRVA